jgi:hypothetical protein
MSVKGDTRVRVASGEVSDSLQEAFPKQIMPHPIKRPSCVPLCPLVQKSWGFERAIRSGLQLLALVYIVSQRNPDTCADIR